MDKPMPERFSKHSRF